jgi:hypothetical protein
MEQGMDNNRKSWYSRGLGPRVDALEVALKALLQQDAMAGKNIRMIAEALRISSPAYGFFEVFEAARMVEEASAADLADRTRGLIKVMRHELADETHLLPALLLVGAGSRAGIPVQGNSSGRNRGTGAAVSAGT